ncbi:Uncharacterised protein [Mycobacteroides abscessus subsp. bolletii]|nr:Uncharacterised protein [Mycobacteroides abscessus subsp. bolletii]SHX39205.1 Uncharacterised protein [Mycobacteroides abscessus subsp. bolletii]SHX44662.1 Uncharacterised protein [Mycobacteroides abscessus subsp. bolletii]SHX89826.1 Uncharacterised protein [Mycobacteroides abscessus subsp. bolletii]SKS43490.1 Uncharacterised protein [Mycobacteroides abscessus subsp. bolletii]
MGRMLWAVTGNFGCSNLRNSFEIWEQNVCGVEPHILQRHEESCEYDVSGGYSFVQETRLVLVS